jgi:predicted anti-sigma-YlaC factor YlaD
MRRLLAHRRMRHAVEAHLDGDLAPEADAQVARHLSVCWECSIVAETLRLLKRALRQLRAKTPTTITERRLRRFAEDLAGRPHPDRAPP